MAHKKAKILKAVRVQIDGKVESLEPGMGVDLPISLFDSLATEDYVAEVKPVVAMADSEKAEKIEVADELPEKWETKQKPQKSRGRGRPRKSQA